MLHEIDKPIAMVGRVQIALGIAGSGNVHDLGMIGADVDGICANAGNELMLKFLLQVENSSGVSEGVRGSRGC
jgi:hypothetical protein